MGGGRIIGEACHFIDFLTFLNGSLPISVCAVSMQAARGLDDTGNHHPRLCEWVHRVDLLLRERRQEPAQRADRSILQRYRYSPR